MLSVFRTSVKCARPRPFWREIEAPGVVSKDMNSEKIKQEFTFKAFFRHFGKVTCNVECYFNVVRPYLFQSRKN